MDYIKLVQEPPKDSTIIDKIIWLLSNPQNWLDLLMENIIEILAFIVAILLLYSLIDWVLKYTLCPKVKLISKEEGRTPNYLGRKLFYIKNKGLFKKYKPKEKNIKGKMIIKEPGFSLQFNTVKIPENIKVKRESSVILIEARNIKYDYQNYKSFIPTNQDFKAISPTETIYTNNISEKITTTNKEVRKATNCNPDVTKYQRMSGSIPLTAAMSDETLENEDKLADLGIGGYKTKSLKKKDKDKKEDNRNKKVSKMDALSDLEKKLGVET